MEITVQRGAVAQAITERRTVVQFKPDPVSPELLEELLDVAVWAPNHHLREPWRFIAVQGEGRRMLASAIYAGFPPERREKVAPEKITDRILSVPMHLIVVAPVDPRPLVYEEDFAAACALIQNLQLAGWELGLGMVWKTDPWLKSPDFRQKMGVNLGEMIVGYMQIGYPEAVPAPRPRTAAKDRLTWVSE